MCFEKLAVCNRDKAFFEYADYSSTTFLANSGLKSVKDTFSRFVMGSNSTSRCFFMLLRVFETESLSLLFFVLPENPNLASRRSSVLLLFADTCADYHCHY